MTRLFGGRWRLPTISLVALALAGAGLMALGPSGRSAAVAECTGRSASDYACFQERYRQLTQVSGIESAFLELKKEYDENELVKAVCHTLAHEIGRAAAVRYGGVAETYARGDTFCGSGYYHGAIETIVSEIGARRAVADAKTICGDVIRNDRRSAYHRNCVHGLGHGFMILHRNDVFDALRVCDRLSDRWEEHNCYDGVFMQNIMSRDDRHYPSKHLRPDEPMYPCTAVESRYKSRCYERQTVQALLTEDGDFDRVFELCGGIGPGFRAACYQGLGRDAAGIALDRFDGQTAQAAQTAALCGLGDDAAARENCIVGAAEFLVRQNHGDAQARKLCRSLQRRLRSVCAGAVERYAQPFA